MGAVFKKEFRSYFNNMIGYVFVVFMLIVVGIYATAQNFVYGYSNFEYVVGGIGFVFLIAVPILTMSSISLEKRQKTDQLLLTSPTSVAKIVSGKYLAMLGVLLIPCLVMLLYPLILSLYGTVNFASAYGAVLGLFFLGAALISIGMFMSSLTENQLIAAVITLGSLILIYLFNGIAGLIPSTVTASFVAFTILALAISIIIYVVSHSGAVAVILFVLCEAALITVRFVSSSLLEGAFPALLGKLALFDGIDSFASGMFDITYLVLYITVSLFFCFLTGVNIEKRRWSE